MNPHLNEMHTEISEVLEAHMSNVTPGETMHVLVFFLGTIGVLAGAEKQEFIRDMSGLLVRAYDSAIEDIECESIH